MILKYLTNKNVKNEDDYARDFINDVTYYQNIKEPVKVKYLPSGHIEIYPTVDDTFPSGREEWYHDNEENDIISEMKPVKLDESLFKL